MARRLGLFTANGSRAGRLNALEIRNDHTVRLKFLFGGTVDENNGGGRLGTGPILRSHGGGRKKEASYENAF